LRLQDAEGMLEYVTSFIKGGLKDLMNLYREDNIRYAAMNLAAIKKYGSIEFRSMRGTMDVDILWQWINALMSIRTFAVNQANPMDIYEMFMSLGPEDFLKKVLGVWSEHFKMPKLEQEMSRSFSLSLDIPHLYRVYKSTFAEKIEDVPVEYKVKNLNPDWEAAPFVALDELQPMAADIRAVNNAVFEERIQAFRNRERGINPAAVQAEVAPMAPRIRRG
jgi:hypothetical protein